VTVTANANPNCTVEIKHPIVTIPPGAKGVGAGVTQQCGKVPLSGSSDSVVPPPPYEVPPQAPVTGCSKPTGLYGDLNKASKSPISTSLPAPTPQSSTESPRIEIPGASEQVHHIDCIDINDASSLYLEITPFSSTSPREELAAVDLSGFDCGDFPEFLGDDTVELLAAFDFGETCEEPNVTQSPSLATDNPVAGNATIGLKESSPSSETRSHSSPNKINSLPSSSYNLQGELRFTNHTPAPEYPLSQNLTLSGMTVGGAVSIDTLPRNLCIHNLRLLRFRHHLHRALHNKLRLLLCRV